MIFGILRNCLPTNFLSNMETRDQEICEIHLALERERRKTNFEASKL